MAVMKTCCGCLSTKSGSMTILLLYTIAYITSIVYNSIELSSDSFQSWVDEQYASDEVQEHDCSTGDNKDTWWCKLIKELIDNADRVLLIWTLFMAAFLITSLLAVYGVSKGRHWFMMPWIVAKFILLFVLFLVKVTVVILMFVYLPEDEDSSNIIAIAVVMAAIKAFICYLWLCVVSHFQILRQVSKLGLGSNMEHVMPFHNEDNDSEWSGDKESVKDHYNDNDGYEEDQDKEEEKKDLSNDDMEYEPQSYVEPTPDAATDSPEVVVDEI